MRSAEWAGDIAYVEIASFADRDLALRAEAEAIASEQPLWNRTHKSGAQSGAISWAGHNDNNPHRKFALFGLRHKSAGSVFHFLASKVCDETFSVAVTVVAIAGALGVSKRTASSAIVGLRAEGFIQVRQMRGTNTYFLRPALVSLPY